MLLYDARIALLSLKRNRVLSALIVGGIALGVAVATTFSAMHHSFARDPLPGQSHKLHYVRIDNWEPAKPYPGDDPTAPPPQISYKDAMALMKSPVPVHQTPSFKSALYVFPQGQSAKPVKARVRLAYSDFFPMFQVPFLYGQPWDRKADEGPEAVVVLSWDLNEQLFGGRDSVGQTLRIEDRVFKVVGVLAQWRPTVKYYDLTNSNLELPEDVYLPFNHVRPMQIRSSGNNDNWGPSPGPGIDGYLASESLWLQYWVELPDAGRKAAYEDWLHAYVQEQKKAGRHPRPVNNRVTALPEYLAEMKVVPREAKVMMIVSLLFLGICAVNLTGLLLGKFLARAPEVGVRRALGARRIDIFVQHIVECELVGLLGGALGLVLALGGLALMNAWLKTLTPRSDLFQMDAAMALFAVALSLAAGFVAGVYPSWRICRTAPAIHLKLQ